MLIDLFYELSIPPFRNTSEAQAYGRILEEIRLADTLGFNTAWLVEHHFMPEYSHSSAPDLILAAISQNTDNIRLGQAVIPLPYHHPIQIAERMATLDILSGGRTEIGFGRGFQPKEFGAFGVDIAKSRERTAESFAILQKALSQRTLHHVGKLLQIPEVSVVPQPIQKPHPPFWMAAVSPDSFKLAAELDVNVLCGPFKPWFMIKEDIKRYRKFTQDKSNKHNKVGMTVGFLCLEDSNQAKSIAKPAFEWFYGELLKHTGPILHDLYESYDYYHKYRYFHSMFSKLATLPVLEKLDMVIVGNPTECLEKLHKLKNAGVDHALLAIGAGIIDEEYSNECMQLIHHEIMPNL